MRSPAVAQVDDRPVDGLGSAADLDVRSLTDALARVEDGVAVVDARGRIAYANPAVCRMTGLPLGLLRDRDLAESLREDGQPVLPWTREDPAAPHRCTVLAQDGAAREVVCSAFTTEVAGSPHWIVILRGAAGDHPAVRTALSLAQTTTKLVGAATMQEVLRGICRHAAGNSTAAACWIVVFGEDRLLATAGACGFPRAGDSMTAWTSNAVTLDNLPGGAEVLAGRPIFLPDARSALLAAPATTAFAITLEELDWQSGYYVPLSWEGEVFGVFAAYLPTGAGAPTEEERSFYQGLAGQAAVAVTNAQLGATLERTRLARELHDSISQALFSMTLHAKAAQLAMAQAGLGTTGALGRSVARLVELTRGTLAEMRSLLFELRPGSLAEEGLVAAVRKQCAALTAREQVAITVDGPEPRLHLAPEVEEHLYRVTSEALNNVIKHARAEQVSVDISATPGVLRIVVCDDGVGFEPGAGAAGHLGQSSMADRARMIGAELTVASRPRAGTTVTLTLAYDPPEQGDRVPDAG
ncbi:histidine kinase [Streptacidiphilus sp. P02-A3a]|uniref:sensor histidine kinase n=1 Tax=Streptacidiphilus sp. P02-A3a TaxID=2704468 RepID=UPI0015FC1C3D|nr:histidine kinase [Streptacidiphilus sp. P02-A3a]QMU73037.1 GAF domain-containing protein [Streptacidiphilus sp. P02-A3a]